MGTVDAALRAGGVAGVRTGPGDKVAEVAQAADSLARLVADGDVLVLSGAGLSTESGIPDYRGPTGTARRVQPMTFQAFIGDPSARRRYWARSHLGWRAIRDADPNAGHIGVARLQHAGLLTGIITQNVDGLHRKAGAGRVVELHGGLDRVTCLTCGELTGRDELDRRLLEANARWTGDAGAERPDGDVELADTDVSTFHVVDCGVCRGVLKPDVVFFGESVPAPRVAACYQLLEQARSVLVLGSSLTVMSGRRFVLRALHSGKPVMIINQGETRCDAYARVRLDMPLGVALARLTERLCGEDAAVHAPAWDACEFD